jgi:hypothetical protein
LAPYDMRAYVAKSFYLTIAGRASEALRTADAGLAIIRIQRRCLTRELSHKSPSVDSNRRSPTRNRRCGSARATPKSQIGS